MRVLAALSLVWAIGLLVGCGTTVKSVSGETAPLVYDGLRKRIAILPFDGKEPSANLKAAQLLSSKIASVPRFLVVDSQRTLNAAKSIKACSMLASASCMFEIATQLGVSAVIYGKIEEFDPKKGRAALEVKVFCGDSGMLCSTVRSAVEGKNPLSRALDDLLPRLNRVLTERIEWWTKVERVESDGELLIGAGSDEGLKLGDILVVRSPGSLIADPDSGEIIGRSKGLEKATVEIVELVGGHQARARVIKGSGVLEGDLVFAAASL